MLKEGFRRKWLELLFHRGAFAQGPVFTHTAGVQEVDRGFHTRVTFDLVQRIGFAERFTIAKKSIQGLL